MSQPQYNGPAFDSGATPTPGAYLDPTTVAPVVDCQAAVNDAMSRRESLENQAMVPNMSNPGTHAGPIGFSPGGMNEDN